jgi:hypothetical protein
LVAIAAAEPAVTQEYVDYVGDAIVAATGDMFDDFEVVRRVSRAAIEAIAAGQR